jgi:4-amino-4-deoxy-L-arabinose transferase-like glycosyltransferase
MTALADEANAPAPDRASWRRDVLLLVMGFALLVGPHLGRRALWNPDEGRYAEIPREMVASGDAITPRIDGIKYFEKPPLGYWVVAASQRVLGEGEAATRLPGALFALAGVLAVYGAGRRLFGRAAGLWSAVVLATSPLWFAMGQIVSLDMPVSSLLTLSLLAFLLATRASTTAARRGWVLAFYVAAALATLTKGLIAIAFPALILGTWVLLTRRWRALLLALSPLGIAAYLLVGVPWHLLAARANPEFAWFYFVHEHFLRYTTTIHARYQPPWFFLPVLLFGLLPWTVLLPRALAGAWRASDEERDATRYLLLWAALVFLFFSASKSKLVPYILPVLPPLALLVGRTLARVQEELGARVARGARGRWATLLALALVFAAAFVALPWVPSAAATAALLGGWTYAIAASLVVLGVLPLLLLARGSDAAPGLDGLAPVGAALGAVLFLTVLAAATPALDDRMSTRALAARLRAELRPGDQVVCYRDYYQDLPFYLRRRVAIAGWRGELTYGSEHQAAPWLMDAAALPALWSGPGRVFVVGEERRVAELHGERLARSGDVVLIVNRR